MRSSFNHASRLATLFKAVLCCPCFLQNRWHKRGLALTPTKFGIAFTKLTYNQGGALVHIYTDGTVSTIQSLQQPIIHQHLDDDLDIHI